MTAARIPNRPPAALMCRVAKIAQAQGRISVQARCTVEEALDLMVERAALAHLTLEEIADGVAHGRIWFS